MLNRATRLFWSVLASFAAFSADDRKRPFLPRKKTGREYTSHGGSGSLIGSVFDRFSGRSDGVKAPVPHFCSQKAAKNVMDDIIVILFRGGLPRLAPAFPMETGAAGGGGDKLSPSPVLLPPGSAFRQDPDPFGIFSAL